MNACAAAARAAATSFVTATGRPTTTRGAGRPAWAAASRMRGTVCSRIVLGPVIQVIVPSASRPVSASILGARAATRIAHGFPPGTASCAFTRYSLPQWLTLPLRMSGPRTARYSFMWLYGFANESPSIPSHGRASRQPGRHPRARPDARARLLRRQAPRRPRRRRGEGRAACGRPGAPPRALLGRHRRPRAFAPLARHEHLQARPDVRPRPSARPRALPRARRRRRRGARDRAHARPRLAGASRPQPAPGPRRAHALRRDGVARALARLRPRRDSHERQPLLHRRSRPRAGPLLAPGVVLPRRDRGCGPRPLRAARPRPA